MEDNKIITLRTVYKVKEYHLQPTKQPNGLNWDFVKPVRVDHEGRSYMDLSEAEKNNPESKYFIAEDEDIVVTEGTTFNLADPLQRNKWYAIKDSDLIAPMRDARDSNGNLLIDGDKQRYGIAELYVDVAGEESERSVNKRKLIIKAQTYVLQDSPNGILTKCRLIGRNMSNAPLTDAQDLLLQEADKNPNRIIDLYTGQDTGIQLLLLDAKEKNIINKTNGWLMYGETNLGANEEAALMFLKTPGNKPIFEALKRHVYPEYAIQFKTQEVINDPEVDLEPNENPSPKKRSSSK